MLFLIKGHGPVSQFQSQLKAESITEKIKKNAFYKRNTQKNVARPKNWTQFFKERTYSKYIKNIHYYQHVSQIRTKPTSYSLNRPKNVTCKIVIVNQFTKKKKNLLISLTQLALANYKSKCNVQTNLSHNKKTSKKRLLTLNRPCV